MKQKQSSGESTDTRISRRSFFGGSFAMLAAARIAKGEQSAQSYLSWKDSRKKARRSSQSKEGSHPPDILIKNGFIATMDHRRTIYRRGSLYIKDGRIASIGSKVNAPSNPGHVIDGEHKLVLPGFVNVHTHVATECFRGVIELFPRTFFIFLIKEFFTDKSLYDLSLLSCAEMIRMGTTCTCDNYQKARIVVQVIANAGMSSFFFS